MVALVVTVALVAVVGTIIGVYVSGRLSSSDASSSQQEQQASDGASTSGGHDASAGAAAEGQATGIEDDAADAMAADEAFHATLVDYYDALSGYDGQIRSAASSFNENYTKEDFSLRTGYASSASVLLGELEQRRDALYALSMPDGTSYASQYADLKRCYDDCVQRISVISQSWENSLRYSNPQDHKYEIIEPISADNVDGSNRYYTDYNDVYPRISL